MPGRNTKAILLWFLFLALSLQAQTGQLRDLARVYLGAPTPAAEQPLRQFAASHAQEETGLLANFALGYRAWQNKEYAKAVELLRAARARPTPVSDYTDYYLALALEGRGDHAGAAELLAEFETKYPNSALRRRAVYALAAGLLGTGQAAASAALVNARRDTLPRPAADLLLARAYEARGNTAAALRAYQEIYYRYPASEEAKEADRRRSRFPKPDVEMLRARAEGLRAAASRSASRAQRSRLYPAAEQAYREIADAAKGAQRERAQVELAALLHQRGRSQAARAALARLNPSDPEAAAQRLYVLGECHRRLRQPADFLSQMERLGRSYPSSSWYEEALLSAGNFFLLRNDASKAASYFTTLYERFPTGPYAQRSLWKAAWLRYREGNYDAARRLMEEQAQKFPAGPDASAALYWLGRLAEASGAAAAGGYFCKASASYPNHFYGLLARQKLERARMPCNPRQGSGPGPAFRDDQPPADRTRLLKVAALKSAWLMDLAATEIQYAAEEGQRRYWLLEMARLERERGRYLASIDAARRAIPEFLTLELPQLPREYWELLFPLPWWKEIQTLAAAEGVDPYLVAGVIRQESAFEERAVSRARALGLMQILPSTGRKLARQLRLPRYSLAALFDAQRNLRLGIVYLKQLLDLYPERLEEALAAYNAGTARVDLWRAASSRDAAEFVESIPITETREYVQAVLRNRALYRKLYPPENTAASGMR